MTDDAFRAHTTGVDLATLDRWWRAANYLSVGQIYLLANPMLTVPLTTDHVKPRLLGHWGTTPGLNFVYAHLNRLIRARDLNMLFVAGPGHGGPAVVANAWLEGTYTETYPDVTLDASGMQRLFHQFSFPGGIPSHAAPETPGSINEGGELGYSLAHAYGTVAAQLPPGRTVRPRRTTCTGHCRAGTSRAAANEREPPRQRRHPAHRPGTARLARPCSRGARAWKDPHRTDPSTRTTAA